MGIGNWELLATIGHHCPPYRHSSQPGRRQRMEKQAQLQSLEETRNSSGASRSQKGAFPDSGIRLRPGDLLYDAQLTIILELQDDNRKYMFHYIPREWVACVDLGIYS